MESINKIVKSHLKKLNASEKNFASIYDIMFSLSDNIMVEYDEGLETKKVTYNEVKKKVEKLAKAIKSKNISNQFIGLSADNSVEWIVMFWAILMSGNKPYLINLRLPIHFTNSILKTLDAYTVLSFDNDINYEIPTLKYEELINLEVEECDFSFANEIALSTSATTLNEKICIYNGEEFCEQIMNTSYVLKKNKLIKTHYKGSLKLLAFLPLYHIFGLSAMYFWFCFFGRTLVLLKDYSPNTIISTTQKHKVTHIFAVPLLWHTIEKQIIKEVESKDEKTKRKFYKGLKTATSLQTIFPGIGRKIVKNKFKLVTNQLFGDSVCFCISGGSYIKDSTLYLMNAIGYPIHNGYGMSEVGITSVELSHKIKERNKNSIGMPFSSIEYKVNENNELLIRGKSICHNLIINGQKQKVDEWFNTNDIVIMDKDGRYYIEGRKSELIIGENGENISPDEIEKCFDLPKALNYSVLGNKQKTSLIMIVQISSQMLKSSLYHLNNEIIAINNSLPSASRLSKIYYTYDAIMSNMAIKVSRKYLSDHIEKGDIKLLTIDEIGVSNLNFNEVDTEIIEILTDLFRKCLNDDLTEINPNSHFMLDLGGTSLDYFSLISMINERFSINLKMDYDHMAYTINDFEKIIKEMLV